MSDTPHNLMHKHWATQTSHRHKGRKSETSSHGAEASSNFRLTAEARRSSRLVIQIPVSLQIDGEHVSCHTRDISPAGVRIASTRALSPGTALRLSFCFGEVCYVNVDGAVIFSQPHSDPQEHGQEIGMIFCEIRDWQQVVLLSALKELKETDSTREKSLVTIRVSKDTLAEAESIKYPASWQESTEDNLFGQAPPLPVSPPPLPDPVTESWVPVSSEIPVARGKGDHKQAIMPPPEPVPTYTLLVNDQDLDTGIYRYFFFADKLISEPKTVGRLIRQVKSGHLPQNIEQYVFARCCAGGREANLAAARAAHLASQEFRHFPLSKRYKIAKDIYDLLIANKEHLLQLMIAEGHPLQLAEWEFFGMEQAYRTYSLDFYKQHLISRRTRDREMLYWMRRPDGVVGVYPPRNAPCSSSLIAGFALLAGNTLVVKPPLQNPCSTMFLWKNVVLKALRLNDAPPGTLNVVVGNSAAIVDEWLHSPYVNDLLFIGDSAVGLEVGKRAFLAGKKPILELSGNDAMFIWKDADLEGAARSLLDGFLGSTQVCMVPKKAFIHEDIYSTFEGRFLEAVKRLKVGLPSDPDVCLSPVAKMREFDEFLTDALSKGAELLCGGTRINHEGVVDKEGSFITPAVLRIPDLTKASDMRCILEETFFPLIPLVKVSPGHNVVGRRARDQAIFERMAAAANNNAYGLRVSVWAKSPLYIQRFKQQVHNSGLLRINCRHIGFSPLLATHGGTGKSGGPFGELNYVWQKTSHLQGVALSRLSPSTE